MSERGRHPEGAAPFDQENGADSRGQVKDGTYPLREGEAVRPDDAQPQESRGSRRILDRVAPPTSKRRKGIATSAAIGAGLIGTAGGGAEWVGYQIGKMTSGGSSLSAEHSPYGVEGVTVDEAREGVERNRQEHARDEAAKEADEAAADQEEVPSSVELDSPNPDDMTSPTGTGGVAAERDPGTGGVAPS